MITYSVYDEWPIEFRTKRCSNCCEILPYDMFTTDNRRDDGCTPKCKICLSEYRRKNRLADLENYRRRGREWRAAHSEECNALYREYYRNNLEAEKDRSKRYNQSECGKDKWRTHPCQSKSKQAEYRRNQREKRNAYNRQYFIDHPEKLKEKGKRRRAKPIWRIHQSIYNSRRRRWIKINGGRHTAADILALYDDQKGECYYCHSPLEIKWHKDHKQPVSRGGTDNPDNLALTCKDCNMRKSDMTEEEFWLIIRR